MKKFKSFVKSHFYIILLCVIGVISHLSWFNFSNILNFGDWIFWPNEATNQLYNSYGTWVNFFNFGAVNIQLPFNFFTSIWSLFTNLGFSYDFATKITFLIPIAILGFISPYILFKKLTKNELISFIVALFYGTTTYFLIRQTSHLPIAFVYAMTPLILYLFVRALEKNEIINWLIFILLIFVGICYEIRIVYIVCFILFFYFLFFHFKDIKKYFKVAFLPVVALIFLNLFWFLPTFFGGFNTEIQQVVNNRGLFGPFLFSLGHAFALFDSSWTGGYLNMEFIKQPIIWYFWFIPIIAFSSFLLSKNSRYKKEIIFFGTISLIGIFLTKQAAEPLAGAYLWLFNNFPGFNLFREASKFYLITAVGYTGLLAYVLLLLKENKNKILNKYLFIGFSVIILLISIFNTKPLITSEIRTMFIPRHIPSDYIILKDFILKQPEYFRIFWTPTYSRWSIYNNQTPKISNVAVIGSEWENYISPRSGYNNLPVNKQITEIFKIKGINELFNISSIKYVIVPIRDFANDDDFFIYYGGKENPNIRDWYILELDKIEWLEKIDIGTNELVVYENENYKPHFYIPQNIIYSDGSIENLADIVNLGDYQIRSGIYFVENGNLLNRADEIFVKGELENEITEEELGMGIESKEVFFPYVSQNPGSFIYPLVLKKEQFDKWKARKEPEKLFEKHLFYASKRISEIMAFGVNELVLANYKKEMVNALEILKKLKQEGSKDFVKLLVKYEGTLWGQREKIKEIENLTDWDSAFQELEGQAEELKIKRDFSKLAYKVEITEDGEYEILMNEDGLENNLGKRYFEKGAQELVLSLSGISENLVDENLRIKDYSPNSIYRISFDYKAPRGGSFFVAEGKTGETAETQLSSTGDEFRHFEMFFKSFPDVQEAAVHLSISVSEEKNLRIEKIYQPEIILKSDTRNVIRDTKQVPKITFVKINPTKYRVKVEGAKEPYTLVFSESFHEGWKLYINRNTVDTSRYMTPSESIYGDVVASYFNEDIKEGTHKNIFLDKNTFETWRKKPIPEEKHLLVNGYANSWYITPEDAGGKQDYELIIEFAPQKLFYIGLFISGITLVGCLIYLLYSSIVKKNRQ